MPPIRVIKNLLKEISRLRILVIGDVMLDHYIWGSAQRISAEAPVPVVDIQRDTYTAGGAANVALNITSLGASAEIGGWVGRDDAGRRLQAILRKKRIGFDRALFISDRPTILKTRVIAQHQQLCRLDREAAPAVYRFEDKAAVAKLAEKISGFDAVVLSDYGKGLIDDELVATVSEAARAAGKLLALDPKPIRRLKFHGPDLLKPNKRESAQLAGIELDAYQPFPSEEICRKIYRLYRPRHLVITLGEDGMLLCERGRIRQIIPTAAREVFDVSGAGDTSMAGLVLALAVGASLEDAAHLANAAAGVVVGKVGTATVTPEEVIATFDQP